MLEPWNVSVPDPVFDRRRNSRYPVRMLHLGLGAFHRAHQAWYTQRANEAGAFGEGWGIEAFTGRSPRAAETLRAQGCLYTLIERGAESDSASVIESISAASSGSDSRRWRAAFADPAVALVSLTVTEPGYHSPDGVLDTSDPEIAADIRRLRLDGDRMPVTAPARIVDGLRARLRAGGVPFAVVSCDNLPNNGRILRDAVIALATETDPELAAWVSRNVSFVSTMVDRITPATVAADRETALELTGLPDETPVVTEPFSEWVLAGDFPAGRPNWEIAGARFVDDIEPYEQRKLWLLNAGHSLLAYRGLLLGHRTIADAFADPDCAAALERLWSEAREVLPLAEAEIDAALDALRKRFSNARIEHRLTQIAKDGSAKLPPRISAVIRRRIAAGLAPGNAQCGVIAAWAVHLSSPERVDPGSDALAVEVSGASVEDLATAAVTKLASDLAADPVVLESVRAQIEELRERLIRGPHTQGAQ